jgi:hypothetical protein
VSLGFKIVPGRFAIVRNSFASSRDQKTHSQNYARQDYWESSTPAQLFQVAHKIYAAGARANILHKSWKYQSMANKPTPTRIPSFDTKFFTQNDVHFSLNRVAVPVFPEEAL